MHAETGVVVSRRIRNLRCIGITWGDQTVDEGRSGIAQDLLRLFQTDWLSEVMIFHRNDEDIAHCRRGNYLGWSLWGHQKNAGCCRGERRPTAPARFAFPAGELAAARCGVGAVQDA